MIVFYLKNGYYLEWIEKRTKAIINRKKLIEVWKENKRIAKMGESIIANSNSLNCKYLSNNK